MSPFVTTCPCRLAFVQNIPDLTAAFRFVKIYRYIFAAFPKKN